MSTEGKNHTETLRKMVIGNNAASNVIYRMAFGSEVEIESILNNASKMMVVLKNVTRLKISDLERLIENVASVAPDTKADYNSVQTVMMHGYVQNRKNA